MSLIIKQADEQDPGMFDNGRIRERKPVNFPGMGTQKERFGPILYWAWAWSESGGLIGEHPHQGFEIMSYVLEGRMEHSDSLGTWKALCAGDIQVMQTNSGVNHSERFADGVRTEMFQIWFEPDLRESVKRKPTYADYPASHFQWKEMGDYKIKNLIGPDAPVQFVAQAEFDELILDPEKWFVSQRAGVDSVFVCIEGEAELSMGTTSGRLKRGGCCIRQVRGGSESSDQSDRCRISMCANYRAGQG